MNGSRATRNPTAIFGANLKTARLAAGLTQRQLAVALGRREMTVSNWERGENRPSDQNLVQLADVLGRDIAWFYREPEDVAAA